MARKYQRYSKQPVVIEPVLSPAAEKHQAEKAKVVRKPVAKKVVTNGTEQPN